MMDVVLLAHQGGWDEILFVLTPIALFAALLFVANKRASRLADQDEELDEEGAEDGRS
jgi:hypothetical protein